ncbi:hypothetical protein ElyMa_000861800 [Elysia marginata]|uniref:G-protein coupled receptors family 1 profile domain-containing protein n=1 Tax=Elysia marginata TaxID=1093978 RepID=A0AAV4H541_9GAST|nr:hypothetical protein ElyMa_000861800 [Elysia marginata]
MMMITMILIKVFISKIADAAVDHGPLSCHMFVFLVLIAKVCKHVELDFLFSMCWPLTSDVNLSIERSVVYRSHHSNVPISSTTDVYTRCIFNLNPRSSKAF